jgi:site-specific recombinase XerC
MSGPSCAKAQRRPPRDIHTGSAATDLTAQDDIRDRVALHLLLDYGLRKGALQTIQFRHFDHLRKRVTIFTKGQKVRDLPIAQAA